MILITLHNSTQLKYSMPVEREKAFMQAWHAMRGDSSFTNQKFKIKLADETVRLVRIGDVRLCQQVVDMVEQPDGSFQQELQPESVDHG